MADTGMEQKGVGEIGDLGEFLAPVGGDAPYAPFIGMHLHLESQVGGVALDNLMKKYPELTDIQIFTHGPQGARPVKAFDPKTFPREAARHHVRIWTHGSYLCVPWKSPFLAQHTVDNLRASQILGSHCVVVHIPFAPVDHIVSGIESVVHKMRSLGICHKTKLMLETSATVQDPIKSYESPEKLNRLTEALIHAGFQDCVRICVDTAHIFAGKAKIRSREDATAFWNALDTRLLGMIQLNGSSRDPEKEKGDKHEVPLSHEDLIWRNLAYAESGCKIFVDRARKLKIPVILEINPRHSDADIRRFIDATK